MKIEYKRNKAGSAEGYLTETDEESVAHGIQNALALEAAKVQENWAIKAKTMELKKLNVSETETKIKRGKKEVSIKRIVASGSYMEHRFAGEKSYAPQTRKFDIEFLRTFDEQGFPDVKIISFSRS